MPDHTRDTLVVFMRWPDIGRCKTRLEPVLGAADTRRLYRAMVEKTFAAAHPLSTLGKHIVAYVEPADRCNDVAEWLGSGLSVWPQPEGDLGSRCRHAMRRAFDEGAKRVAIIGSDLPHISPLLLAEAFSVLREQAAVIGPAADGGFWLLGLSRELPDTFDGVPWSTREALAGLQKQLAAAGVVAHMLPVLRDVDTPDDLAAVLPEWRDWLSGESNG
ncbi:MAG: TIGR04282 family arsenosugar biosynthesis glycosyltransferase [Planctomycetota bacterium]